MTGIKRQSGQNCNNFGSSLATFICSSDYKEVSVECFDPKGTSFQTRELCMHFLLPYHLYIYLFIDKFKEKIRKTEEEYAAQFEF